MLPSFIPVLTFSRHTGPSKEVVVILIIFLQLDLDLLNS